MLIEKIKYERFDGTEIERTFYFNITETELNKWFLGTGTAAEYFEFLANKGESPRLSEIYYNLIDLSYGEPTEDGDGFMKTPELLAKFKASDAYNQLCIKMLSDEEYANKFFMGVLPKNLRNSFDPNTSNAKHPALKK